MSLDSNQMKVIFNGVTVYSHFNILDHLSLSVISYLFLISFVITVILTDIEIDEHKLTRF